MRSDAGVDATGLDVLVGTHVLEFPGGYTRSVGPVVGRFLTELRAGRFVGLRRPDGTVLCPPTEYDPATGAELLPPGAPEDTWVEVGPAGEVTTWAWVTRPRPKHPLQTPFAWALIRLDGAGSALLHAVDAGSAEVMRAGLRVRPRWRDERIGSVLDVVCFEPEVS